MIDLAEYRQNPDFWNLRIVRMRDGLYLTPVEVAELEASGEWDILELADYEGKDDED